MKTPKNKLEKTSHSMRIGVVVPHIFMQDKLLPEVIFSPGRLAIQLCDALTELGHEVTLFSPGKVTTLAKNHVADLSLFENELQIRGDTYLDLLRKHPLTFVTLARQVQSAMIASAYTMANENKLDLVHIYTNEEETALPFASLCKKPVVFTHHDPFNFLVRYKNNFPKYSHLNWTSISLAQRSGMPAGTHWVGNVYHGLDDAELEPVAKPDGSYLVFIGRIIQPKGVHLAIKAVQAYNRTATRKLTLKIAGKHYSGSGKDDYWQQQILPNLDDPYIDYVGFLSSSREKQLFLANAAGTIVPSLFDEPFGLVTIESFACGTPVIGLDSGALPEVIDDGVNGLIVKKQTDDEVTVARLAEAISRVQQIDRNACRRDYEHRFTAARMARDYEKIYLNLIQSPDQS